MSFYHFAEFATVACYNPEILNIDSFLVNQVSARMWLVPAFHSCLSLILCHRAYAHNHALTSCTPSLYMPLSSLHTSESLPRSHDSGNM